MPLRAVIFDFDGVISDTENIHIAAWQRTFAALGWEVSDEVCAQAAEIDDRAFLASIFAKRKIEGGDVEGWVRRKQQLTVALLADSPRLYPGVPRLVESLRKQVRLAIVSTTWRANITTVLEAGKLDSAFETIVAKEDVKVVKPDPEGYLLALKRLKVPTADAIALEDSPTGLKAARQAGLRALAIGHRLAPGDWAETSTYVARVGQVEDVLRELAIL